MKIVTFSVLSSADSPVCDGTQIPPASKLCVFPHPLPHTPRNRFPPPVPTEKAGGYRMPVPPSGLSASDPEGQHGHFSSVQHNGSFSILPLGHRCFQSLPANPPFFQNPPFSLPLFFPLLPADRKKGHTILKPVRLPAKCHSFHILPCLSKSANVGRFPSLWDTMGRIPAGSPQSTPMSASSQRTPPSPFGSYAPLHR